MSVSELQWKKDHFIKIGMDLIGNAGNMILPYLKSSKVFIITDENVAHYHLGELESSLSEAGISNESHIIEPGENSKSFHVLQKLLEAILASDPTVDSTIIALGGGVVGDIAGLVASLLLRGIDLIHIPTTLISQVDSAIGGKTAINSKYGKNLIGSMWEAKLTLIDVNLLQTLPHKDFVSGYAEVVKYAVLYNEKFFHWLHENLEKVLAKEELLHMIKTCCQMKVAVVANDQYDKKRVMLNFGHTIAHAIEAASQYRISHGEAVSIGMVMESAISDIDHAVIKNHLQKAGLPVSLREVNCNIEDICSYLKKDKKIKNDIIIIVMLEKIGKSYTEYVSCDFLCNVIHDYVY